MPHNQVKATREYARPREHSRKSQWYSHKTESVLYIYIKDLFLIWFISVHVLDIRSITFPHLSAGWTVKLFSPADIITLLQSFTLSGSIQSIIGTMIKSKLKQNILQKSPFRYKVHPVSSGYLTEFKRKHYYWNKNRISLQMKIIKIIELMQD